VAGENYIMWGFIICDLKNSTLWSEKRKGRNRSEDVNVDGRITINPFVTSGTYMSRLQRVFSSPLG